MIQVWQRHDLLRVDPGYRPPGASREALQWIAQGGVLIVRRYLPQDDLKLVPLAFALPAAPKNLGLTLQIAPSHLCGVNAVTLTVACKHAPSHWQATFTALDAAGRRSGSIPFVYGSLLWQTLTGTTYLKPTSDLDLLWHVRDYEQAMGLSDSLIALAADSPMRIDGELLLPDGSGLHWRELQDGSGQILIKTLRGVHSRSARQLFSAQ